MATRLLRSQITCFVLVMVGAIAGAAQDASISNCAPMRPGGDLVIVRVLPVSLPRAHELLEDAMQANGVILYKNTADALVGERVGERIKSLHLPKGDEAISVTLRRVEGGEIPATHVEVKTMSRSFKKGAPNQSWSTAVMEQASCLLTLLSIDNPTERRPIPSATGEEITIPANTPLLVRSRRFLFNTDVKIGQSLPFEVAVPLIINGQTVIPRGAAVLACMEQISDSKSFGRAAKGQLIFKHVVLPDGRRLPLRGSVDFYGKTTHTQGIVSEGATLSITAAIVAAGGSGALLSPALAAPGLGFAMPAGSLATTTLDGEQKVTSQGSNASARPIQ